MSNTSFQGGREFVRTLLRSDQLFFADIDPLNASGAQGQALLALNGTTLTVGIGATGVDPNGVHPIHIHGFPPGTPDSQVPGLDDDADQDHFVEVAEGAHDYGPILLSLNKNGSFPSGTDTFLFTETYQLPSTPKPNSSLPVLSEQGLTPNIPLTQREIVIHGLTLPNELGLGGTNSNSVAPNEADGTPGYKAVLPVAAGEIEKFNFQTEKGFVADLVRSFGSGGEIKQGVDVDYYLFMNPDVKAAGLDPAQHYLQFGAKEGRDPNAFFSTSGYLAANADVAKAGLNPLQHYDQFGWKEGRDPGVHFDNEQYLARNPDVKAAGIDPLLHFLQFGQAEGRQAETAIGRAGDIGAAKGFDAEYYLLANADVAKAASAASGDTFAFARFHFDTYGWKEGRDPNAVFDTKGYLAAYGDVKAAGINPLTHYDSFGFKEGRDASAEFDTSSYLAAYKDVAAAGVDPMTHYLQFGAVEGRSTFADGHFG